MRSQLDQADRHRKEERVLQEVELAEELIYVTRQYAHAAHNFTFSVMLSKTMSSQEIKRADRDLTLISEKWGRISGKLRFGEMFCLVKFEVDAFESEVTMLTLARTQKYRSLGSDSPMPEELLPYLNITSTSRGLEVSLAQAISTVRGFVSEGADGDIEDKIAQAKAKIVEEGALFSRAWSWEPLD